MIMMFLSDHLRMVWIWWSWPASSKAPWWTETVMTMMTTMMAMMIIIMILILLNLLCFSEDFKFLLFALIQVFPICFPVTIIDQHFDLPLLIINSITLMIIFNDKRGRNLIRISLPSLLLPWMNDIKSSLINSLEAFKRKTPSDKNYQMIISCSQNSSKWR